MKRPPKKLRVLLVDDEPVILRSLSRRLGAHQVFQAESGDQAEEILSRESLDIVISDNSMPGRGGVETLRLVSRRQPRAVRIMFSGTPPDNLQQFVDEGLVQHVFSKTEGQSLINLLDTISGPGFKR